MSYNLRPASLTPSVWPLLRREMRSVSDKQPCKENDDNNIICLWQPATTALSHSPVRSKMTKWTSTNSSSFSWPSWLVSSILNVASALSLATSWQEDYLDWLTSWALYLADPLLLTHTSDHLHHLGCVHEASQEKYFFNPIFPIIFMRRCWVWILTFFSSSGVFYYVYREVSETQCACWPEESVSYILKAHRNFSSEQDSSSGWVANMNS